MPYSNISASLEAPTLASIQTKITEIRALLPFLVSLTNAERIRLPKMADGTTPFVGKALSYAESTPALVPPYLDVVELKQDFALAQALGDVLRTLGQLTQSVQDTQTAVGSEAYAAALTFYQTTKQAAKMGAPGANAIYQDLKGRFESNGPAGTPATPPTPPSA